MQDLQDPIDKNMKALPARGGFKVPPGYFNDLKVIIQYQTLYVNQQPESEENLEDYFASSRKQILSKTTERNSKYTMSVKPLFYYLGVAASMLMVAGTLFGLRQSGQQSIQPYPLSDEEIMSYLQQDPSGELQLDEVVNAIPVNAIPVENNEEEYLMIETL
jgi:hypothetical protein